MSGWGGFPLDTGEQSLADIADWVPPKTGPTGSMQRGDIWFAATRQTSNHPTAARSGCSCRAAAFPNLASVFARSERGSFTVVECQSADHALTLSRAIGSARVIERLSEFNEALTPFNDRRDAHEFRERFALAMAAA
jgi:hypothetical protein